MGEQTIKGDVAEVIGYAHTSTGEMRWVLRFVACYLGALTLAPFVVAQLQVLQRPADYASYYLHDWRGMLSLLEPTLGALVFVGIFLRWRVALWALILWPLLPSIDLLNYVSFSFREACLYWVRSLAPGAIVSFLAWLLYRRAERSGILLPFRPQAVIEAPVGNDTLWLVKGAGIYALSHTVSFVSYSVLKSVSSLQGFDEMEFPRQFGFSAVSIALVSALAVPLAFGRWRVLPALAAFQLAAPFIGLIAIRIDLARSAKFGPSMMPITWQHIVRATIYGLASFVTLIVLYLRARRVSRPQIA